MRSFAIAAAFAGLLSTTWVPEPPLGLELFLPVPETNPLTPEKVALGESLFFDTALSRDRTLSCASCHAMEEAFSDRRPVAIGIGGARGTRNAPALINRGYGSTFFWDGRAASLERQVLEPILNPMELALTITELEPVLRLDHSIRCWPPPLAVLAHQDRVGQRRFFAIACAPAKRDR